MKKLERYNLICNIAIKMQSDFNTTGINLFLGQFGIEHEMVNIVSSKRSYVENLLQNVSDQVILKLARELNIQTQFVTSNIGNELKNYLSIDGYQAAMHDFERALEYINTDPDQALGSASSTLESICKSILDSFKEQYPKDQSLQSLLKIVFSKMNLSLEGHADPDIRRVLGGLLSVAVGIGVLRSKYSGFHGKGTEQKRKRLTERHARLSVNAASTVGIFLIETYKENFN
jgi:hypothetical protein